MTVFLKPKRYETKDMDGMPLVVTLHRFPATKGREILVKYPVALLPKVSVYKDSEDVMLELMKYITIDTDNGPVALETLALVDNHTRDAQTCIKIENAMMGYNFGFFQNGRISTFLIEFARTMLGKIFETSTLFSVLSSMGAKQPSTNSEQSTI